jgi:hypothetical protein
MGEHEATSDGFVKHIHSFAESYSRLSLRIKPSNCDFVVFLWSSVLTRKHRFAEKLHE